MNIPICDIRLDVMMKMGISNIEFDCTSSSYINSNRIIRMDKEYPSVLEFDQYHSFLVCGTTKGVSEGVRE